MKHLPEAHQSVVPNRSILAVFVALIAVMAIIYIVVALAA